jgi:ubiquinone/menaquinone biosynthesis C-methylase UbiE
MGNKVNIVSSIHNSTPRNYVKRMMTSKVSAMKIARKFGKDYWDGKRMYGYGGYKYIEDYWKPVALKLIKKYKLTNKSNILDIGCGKGFLLYEIKKIIPKITIAGIDISKYAILNSPKPIKKFLKNIKAQDKYPYKDKSFDLAISLGCIHNLNIYQIESCINEINRVSKKQYLMTESYRSEKELFNLQCWALTCNLFFNVREWEWLFNKFKFKGDYEFIYFK